MREFRIEPDEAARKKLARRNMSWTVLVTCSPVFLILLIFVPSEPPILRTIIPFAIIAVCAGVYYVAFRLGRERGELGTLYLLTEQEIIRRRNGWPDDRIRFNEISNLVSTRRYLMVKSADPLKGIAVSKKVQGYSHLLAELEERLRRQS